MTYQTPDFVEIKMDAEIGSYQGSEDTAPAPVAPPAPTSPAER
jgi:hypothetical protein